MLKLVMQNKVKSDEAAALQERLNLMHSEVEQAQASRGARRRNHQRLKITPIQDERGTVVSASAKALARASHAIS